MSSVSDLLRYEGNIERAEEAEHDEVRGERSVVERIAA